MGVCSAALLLADMGRLHAIGCMVGAPQWVEWAPRLKERCKTRLDVGLHLDLTEHPLRLPPRRLSRLIASSWLGNLDRSAIRLEICAQLDAFEQQVGRTPAYVDGHQHVHQFPVVRDELLAELLNRYPKRLPWLRHAGAAPTASKAGAARARPALKSRVITALGSTALAAAGRRMGFQQNAHLLGVHDFTANEADYLGLLRQWLRNCGDGDLLMCHPSLLKNAADPLAGSRLTEYQVLSGEAFGALLRAEDIALQALSQTLAQGSSQPMAFQGRDRRQSMR